MSIFKSMFGRKFRQSLGICQDEKFDEQTHGLSRRSCSRVDAQYEAKNCFVPLWRDVSPRTIKKMHGEASHRN